MSDLPRDTPVETPAVLAPVQLGAEATAASALARVRALETLEHAFSVWAELRAAAAAAQRRWDDERRALKDQGELLLGAVRVAGQVAPGTAAPTGALAPQDFLAEAQGKLAAAAASLEAQIDRARAELEQALRDVRGEVLARVLRHRDGVKPAFRVSVRVLGGDRRILHARRLGEDEAVVALHVLTGRIPSRYAFLFDDSTDDLGAAPPTLYAEEGIAPGEVRLAGRALADRLEALPEVWPVKGMLPMPTPVGFARWLQRGVVMEAEIADGDGFRNLLTKDEAEQLTGLLLAHKLAGRLELELVRE